MPYQKSEERNPQQCAYCGAFFESKTKWIVPTEAEKNQYQKDRLFFERMEEC
jgi:hypothetical protein